MALTYTEPREQLLQKYEVKGILLSEQEEIKSFKEPCLNNYVIGDILKTALKFTTPENPLIENMQELGNGPVVLKLTPQGTNYLKNNLTAMQTEYAETHTTKGYISTPTNPLDYNEYYPPRNFVSLDEILKDSDIIDVNGSATLVHKQNHTAKLLLQNEYGSTSLDLNEDINFNADELIVGSRNSLNKGSKNDLFYKR